VRSFVVLAIDTTVDPQGPADEGNTMERQREIVTQVAQMSAAVHRNRGGELIVTVYDIFLDENDYRDGITAAEVH
jgi:hypothetical protein